jgi:heme-degrading monooxygenase HmoA
MRRAKQGKETVTLGESSDMLYARVLTFHVEQDHMSSVIVALNSSLAKLNDSPGYKGLLCLEHDGVRNQILIITLWDSEGLASSAQEAQEAMALISDVSDSGVSIRAYEVLGLIPSPDGIPDVALTRI